MRTRQGHPRRGTSRGLEGLGAHRTQENVRLFVLLETGGGGGGGGEGLHTRQGLMGATEGPMQGKDPACVGSNTLASREGTERKGN